MNLKLEEIMDDEVIEARIKKVIIEHLHLTPTEYRNDARIVDDFGADSLDTVELVMAIEEEFGIQISNEEAERALTVADTIQLVKQYVRPDATSAG